MTTFMSKLKNLLVGMSVLRQCKYHVKQQVRRKAELSVSRELLHSHIESNDLCSDEDRGREVMISSGK